MIFVLYLLQKLFNNILNYFNNLRTPTIIYKSDHYIIINKPYDVKINSNNKEDVTIQTYLNGKCPDLSSSKLYHNYYFMHRLDYSTSGIMCIPIHKRACQLACKAMEEKRCQKFYLALVRGHSSRKLLDLKYSIGRDQDVKEIEKMRVVNTTVKTSSVKSCRTIIVVLEEGVYDCYPSTKILIRPITGRRHQIRVHCSHIGHTIIGDYTYSNKKDMAPFRMFLHSFRLILYNDIEALDYKSEDPFTASRVPKWAPVKVKMKLDEGFRTINNYLVDNK